MLKRQGTILAKPKKYLGWKLKATLPIVQDATVSSGKELQKMLQSMRRERRLGGGMNSGCGEVQFPRCEFGWRHNVFNNVLRCLVPGRTERGHSSLMALLKNNQMYTQECVEHPLTTADDCSTKGHAIRAAVLVPSVWFCHGYKIMSFCFLYCIQPRFHFRLVTIANSQYLNSQYPLWG